MQTFKLAGAAAVAAVSWLTGTFGELWWVLLVLLAADAIFNWSAEAVYWRRVLGVVGSLVGTAYLQHQGLGIAGLHAVLAGLVAWESVRVGEQLTQFIHTLQVHSSLSAADGTAMQAVIAELQAKLKAMESAKP